jgi:hypothetical protein
VVVKRKIVAGNQIDAGRALHSPMVQSELTRGLKQVFRRTSILPVPFQRALQLPRETDARKSEIDGLY